MNIQQAKTELIRTVRAYTARTASGQPEIPVVHQRPVLLIGPPGIGKTAIVQQAASECGVALVSYTITHHTRQSAVGLPMISQKEYGGRTYTATEYTMSEIVASLYDTMERTGLTQGILFIDEINCVSETLAPTMLQLLQNKTFGSHRLPEGWIIAAAGNPSEYNRSVRELDMVTLDRVKRIEVEADLSVWQSYALEHGVHPAILAYLQVHPEHFYRVHREKNRLQFVTARGWEDLSRILLVYEKLHLPTDEALVSQYIQEDEAAAEFSLFLGLYDRYRESWPLNAVLGGETADSSLAAQAKERLRRAAPDERAAVIQMTVTRLASRCARHEAAETALRSLTEALSPALPGLSARLANASPTPSSTAQGAPAANGTPSRGPCADKGAPKADDTPSRGSCADKGAPRADDSLFAAPAHTCADSLAALLERRRSALAVKREAGILTALESETEPIVLSSLERLFTDIRGMDLDDCAALNQAESLIAQKRQLLANAAAQISELLSHGIAFFDDALDDESLRALFPAALSASPQIMAFVGSHGCPAYDDASRRLLAAEEREALLREIDRLQSLE